MILEQSVATVVTIANAMELTSNIARKVLGNDVADTFQGSELSRGLIHRIVGVEIQSALSIHTQAVPKGA